MVSITSVTSDQAMDYYTKKDNYYSREPGEWFGRALDYLGLEKELEERDFRNLLERKDLKGNQVIQKGIGENQGERRAAVDLTFSAPKSVSIMSLVVSGEYYQKIADAHNEAVSNTLEYIEQNYSQARQSEGGAVTRVDTGNLIVAVYSHDLSRELDPQLHSHCLLVNQTMRSDGKMVAVDYKEIYDNKMLIGQFYRNELAANLKEIGYDIRHDDKGLFEIAGIERDLIDAFSRRSSNINAKIKELRESGLYANASESKLREIAALGSREPKQDVDIHAVRESWEERLKGLGYEREEIISGVRNAADQRDLAESNSIEPKPNEFDYVRLAADVITQNESAFSKEDLLLTAGKLTVGEYRLSELEKAFQELNGDKEIITLDSSREIYSTREMLEIENSIFEKVRIGRDSFEAIISKEEVGDLIESKHSDLTGDQRKAVEHILTTKDLVTGIQGSAGTGKTTMLDAVREEFEKSDVTVRGLAFTGKAAEELEKEAGIRSQTIHSFLISENVLSENREIWIVDEASTVGSRQINEIMNKADEGDVQIILVGDIKQLQTIQAGPVFERLQSMGAMSTVNMDSIVRQEDGLMLDVARLAQDKEVIESVFNQLHDNNRIHEISGKEDRMEALVRDFTSCDDFRDSLVITGTNRDRNELNYLIREELKLDGRLSGDEHTFTVQESKNLSSEERHFAQSYEEGDRIYAQKAGIIGRAGTEAQIIEVDQNRHSIMVETETGKEFEIDVKQDGDKISVFQEKEASFVSGDQVIFLKNDKRLEVQNGLTGEITSLDDDGNFTVALSNGKEISFNVSDYPYIDYGYAATTFKSQGMTTQEVFFYSDTSNPVDYNEFYVAVTRSKHDIHVYTNDAEGLLEQAKEAQEKTFTLDYQEVENHEQNETGAEKDNGYIEEVTEQDLDKDNQKDKEDRSADVDFEKENKSDYPEHEKDEDSQSGQPESEKEGNDYKDIEISF